MVLNLEYTPICPYCQNARVGKNLNDDLVWSLLFNNERMEAQKNELSFPKLVNGKSVTWTTQFYKWQLDVRPGILRMYLLPSIHFPQEWNVYVPAHIFFFFFFFSPHRIPPKYQFHEKSLKLMNRVILFSWETRVKYCLHVNSNCILSKEAQSKISLLATNVIFMLSSLYPVCSFLLCKVTDPQFKHWFAQFSKL